MLMYLPIVILTLMMSTAMAQNNDDTQPRILTKKETDETRDALIVAAIQDAFAAAEKNNSESAIRDYIQLTATSEDKDQIHAATLAVLNRKINRNHDNVITTHEIANFRDPKDLRVLRYDPEQIITDNLSGDVWAQINRYENTRGQHHQDTLNNMLSIATFSSVDSAKMYTPPNLPQKNDLQLAIAGIARTKPEIYESLKQASTTPPTSKDKNTVVRSIEVKAQALFSELDENKDNKITKHELAKRELIALATMQEFDDNNSISRQNIKDNIARLRNGNIITDTDVKLANSALDSSPYQAQPTSEAAQKTLRYYEHQLREQLNKQDAANIPDVKAFAHQYSVSVAEDFLAPTTPAKPQTTPAKKR